MFLAHCNFDGESNVTLITLVKESSVKIDCVTPSVLRIVPMAR